MYIDNAYCQRYLVYTYLRLVDSIEKCTRKNYNREANVSVGTEKSPLLKENTYNFITVLFEIPQRCRDRQLAFSSHHLFLVIAEPSGSAVCSV